MDSNTIKAKTMKQSEAYQKFLNTKFKINTSCCKEVQKKLFAIGYEWKVARTNILHEIGPYIRIDNNGLIHYSNRQESFTNRSEREISVDAIMSVQIDDEGSCSVCLPEEPIVFRPETTTTNDKWVFEGGKREAPFYMVYADGFPNKMYDTMQEATEEADRLAKANNRRTYVLAACMLIEPEVVTHGKMIMDMV